jgi:hypothetical protein
MRMLAVSKVAFVAAITALAMPSVARKAAPEGKSGFTSAGTSAMSRAAPAHHASRVLTNRARHQVPPPAVAAIAKQVHAIEQNAGKYRKVAEDSDIGWTADYFAGQRRVKSVDRNSDFVREYYFSDGKLIFVMVTFAWAAKGSEAPCFEKYYYANGKLIFWANNYNQTSKVSDRVAHEASLNVAYSKLP